MFSKWLVCLPLAFLCLTASADPCAGGVGGGMDVNGNECTVGGNESAVASMPPMRPRVAAVHLGRGRSIHIAFSVRPIHSTSIENAVEATCSGGTNGGMDATGNECNETESVGGIVIASLLRR
jgi:hypothetical protein